MKILKIMIPVFALISLACQEKKQLTEMHDNTAQMNQTTGKMAKTTDEMAGTTEHMAKTTDKMAVVTEKMQGTTENVAVVSSKMNEKMSNVVDTAQKTYDLMGELYDASRQGAAVQIRQGWWDRLLSAKQLDRKLVNAAEYFVAFEFEVWSGKGPDTISGRREALAKDAVEEFLHFLATVAHWDAEELNPFAQPLSKIQSGEWFTSEETLNQKASFNMVAAVLHKVNRKQEFASRTQGMDVLNMYKLLETGLLAGKEIRSGRKTIHDFPPFVDEVLREEENVIRLMQARYNMLGLILIGRMTNIQDSLWTGAGLKIFHENWKFDLGRLNHSQLKFYNMHLQYAVETRQLLEKLQQPLRLDKDVKKIFENLQIEKSTQTTVGSEIDADRNSFEELVRAYIK